MCCPRVLPRAASATAVLGRRRSSPWRRAALEERDHDEAGASAEGCRVETYQKARSAARLLGQVVVADLNAEEPLAEGVR